MLATPFVVHGAGCAAVWLQCSCRPQGCHSFLHHHITKHIAVLLSWRTIGSCMSVCRRRGEAAFTPTQIPYHCNCKVSVPSNPHALPAFHSHFFPYSSVGTRCSCVFALPKYRVVGYQARRIHWDTHLWLHKQISWAEFEMRNKGILEDDVEFVDMSIKRVSALAEGSTPAHVACCLLLLSC
jgi:hypothetical protein